MKRTDRHLWLKARVYQKQVDLIQKLSFSYIFKEIFISNLEDNILKGKKKVFKMSQMDSIQFYVLFSL